MYASNQALFVVLRSMGIQRLGRYGWRAIVCHSLWLQILLHFNRQYVVPSCSWVWYLWWKQLGLPRFVSAAREWWLYRNYLRSGWRYNLDPSQSKSKNTILYRQCDGWPRTRWWLLHVPNIIFIDLAMRCKQSTGTWVRNEPDPFLHAMSRWQLLQRPWPTWVMGTFG